MFAQEKKVAKKYWLRWNTISIEPATNPPSPSTIPSLSACHMVRWFWSMHTNRLHLIVMNAVAFLAHSTFFLFRFAPFVRFSDWYLVKWINELSFRIYTKAIDSLFTNRRTNFWYIQISNLMSFNRLAHFFRFHTNKINSQQRTISMYWFWTFSFEHRCKVNYNSNRLKYTFSKKHFTLKWSIN